ncbi:MAG: hypothetical protein QXO86_04715 [Nitrososphaerota archaeon]
MTVFYRYEGNPIIRPDDKSWRSLCTFNPGVIELKGVVYILFRAMSADMTSTIGLAVSRDGLNVSEVLDEPVYTPRESFEMKLKKGHSGCEDPRIVVVGDRIFMFYTAYDGLHYPQVALTWIYVEDFLDFKWSWATPRIISPPDIDDKDACIIPERLDGGFFFVHRAGGINIVYDYIPDLDAADPGRLRSHLLMSPRFGLWDNKKVGLASPPLKINEGWLTFYHGVSSDNVYRVGAVLLDINNPTCVLFRTQEPLLSPQMWYEKSGYVDNVVFPCGSLIRNDKVYIYYGGADKYVCVATATLSDVLMALRRKD